eukprot:1146543-Pelagomonas_calceolata.AAC.4
MASASSSLPGKVIACWMPIFAFVTIGLVGSAEWWYSLSGWVKHSELAGAQLVSALTICPFLCDT